MDIPTYTPEDAPVPDGEIVIERASTAQDLGPKLNRTAADVVRFLMQQGEMVTATQSLSDDMIELFVAEVGGEIRLVNPGEEQEVELQKMLQLVEPGEDGEVATRPPVITVMGHVDHGKTKLLDQIRNTNVVDTEAGGITQHIGAYQIERDGQKITFIDTPGHEAFTAMRARGAQATDLVILVVAADDGVMPQTIEALNHAKAADVPIVVAVNKIDRDNADTQKVLSQIAEHNLVPEAWGGDTIVQEVSALENIGIEELLEQLLVVGEVEELRTEFHIALEMWRQSLEASDAQAYLSLYSEDFRHRGMDKAKWSSYRTGVFASRVLESVSLDDMLLIADPEEPGLFLSLSLIHISEPTTPY